MVEKGLWWNCVVIGIVKKGIFWFCEEADCWSYEEAYGIGKKINMVEFSASVAGSGIINWRLAYASASASYSWFKFVKLFIDNTKDDLVWIQFTVSTLKVISSSINYGDGLLKTEGNSVVL